MKQQPSTAHLKGYTCRDQRFQFSRGDTIKIEPAGSIADGDMVAVKTDDLREIYQYIDGKLIDSEGQCVLDIVGVIREHTALSTGAEIINLATFKAKRSRRKRAAGTKQNPLHKNIC